MAIRIVITLTKFDCSLRISKTCDFVGAIKATSTMAQGAMI